MPVTKVSVDRLNRFYEAYGEETRLSRDNMHRVEFITAVHVLDPEIPKESRILDVAAGVGKYALYYASKGHQVWAQDIVVAHVDRMRHIVQETGVANVDVAREDARDLSRFQDDFFDVVLCMGPIYHMADQQERIDCLRENLRVLKPGGLLAVTYMSMPVERDPRFRDEVGGVRMDSCFFPSTPESVAQMLGRLGLRIEGHVATDGLARQVRDLLNQFGEEEFGHWMDFHLKVCRRPVSFSYSYDGLFVCRKEG
jgi:ubiquinone/menaquinone biosynthesis C-methylase UbiE